MRQLTLIGLVGLAAFWIGAPAQASIVHYEVTFDATWSKATHPNAYPDGAHFSPLIGGTHNGSVVFWEPNGLASLGIQNMAELGATSQLRKEVNAAIGLGTAKNVLAGSGLGSPGKTSLLFDVDSDFPLVTLVSMIAPSPDWFVGVHGLPLFENGVWRDNVVVQLLPYDAGTDSGATFTSPDLVTSPHVGISQITGNPFGGTGPLGTFTFRIVPEPSGIALALCGIAGLGLLATSPRQRTGFLARFRR